MGTAFIPKKRSYYILVITLSCLLGAVSSFSIISSNLRSYPELPEFIGISDNSGEVKYYKVSPPADSSTRSITNKILDPAKSKYDVPIVNSYDTIFNRNPSFLIWMMLIMILVSIVTGSIPIFIGNAYRIVQDYKLNWKPIVLATIFSLAIVLFAFKVNTRGIGLYMPSFFIDDLNILLHNGSIADAIVFMVIAFQIPIIVSMFLSGPASDKIKISVFSQASVEKAAKKLEDLEKTLRLGLKTMTVLVVISVYTAEAFGLAILNEVHIAGLDVFPSEVDYLYGLSFSFTLAIVYIPSHIYLNTKREALQVYAAEQINSNEEVEKIWLDKFLEKMSIQKSAMESVKVTLMLMAPVISSILPSHFQG